MCPSTGTAGCVLASRLSEDSEVTVLLIEAGKNNQNVLESRMPLAFPKLFFTQYDWNYETVPQAALNGRRVHWPRGKLLGGTSSINACLHHHSAPEDYANWVKLGATGWAYEDLLPYFRKAEKYTASAAHPDVDASLHGNAGPWQTRHCDLPASVPLRTPVCQAIVESCDNIGIPYKSDFNTISGTIGSANFIEFVNQKGERSSTATAYLNPTVLARPNLTVLVETATEKIMFNSSAGNPRATGVQISKSSELPSFYVAATKEVILCAGVVATPQILMISGIGPKAELERFDIRPVAILEDVGKHLSDHLSPGPMVFPCRPGYSMDYLSKPVGAAVAAAKWLLTGKGPMSHSVVPGAAFFRSDNLDTYRLPFGPARKYPVEDLTTGAGAPDGELTWFPLVAHPSGMGRMPKGTQGITLGGIVLQPKSKGTITLNSGSVWEKPAIDGNYLQDESDINFLIRMVHLQRALAHTPPFSEVLDVKENVTDTNSIFWPADAPADMLTDDVLRKWLRVNATSAWHPVGSARMGPSPADSVVDLELRVHGVDGLRVCDASVFPTQLSGHPCAPVVAFAERLADFIKRGRKHI
ncbi:GMC oxidoreductase [Gloeophyllum trabeum ATCC 11539]|uniref:GMC oxidoreductase n=1 Tax=Gloeophyllum trabeum (strain ATCC 11539 / FP-39264 / Madison 617) TaxID=670483 RepID=S7S055_GLOTA|nr:GMC oxidoreductase [Gloeophyllum trabeum ATCC 11539]EPQ59074.1 GMC oxidoreductase [Gloeophyllum trabeum ATCC 11539]